MTDDNGEEAVRLRKKVVYKPAESGTRTAAVARGPAKRPPPRPVRAPVKKEVTLDADHAWIRDSLKASQYVGDITMRRDQYLNKLMSLKRKFPSGPEREYAKAVDSLLERLKQYPLQLALRDVLRQDTELKKLRFF